MKKYLRKLPETIWEDEKGFCKIAFYPDKNNMFFEVGSPLQIIDLKLSLGSSFIDFLNNWHEFRNKS